MVFFSFLLTKILPSSSAKYTQWPNTGLTWTLKIYPQSSSKRLVYCYLERLSSKENNFGSLMFMPSILLIDCKVVCLICISLPPGAICVTRMLNLLLIHCSFASHFRQIIQEAFGRSFPSPNDSFDLWSVIHLLALRRWSSWLLWGLSSRTFGASVMVGFSEILFHLLIVSRI